MAARAEQLPARHFTDLVERAINGLGAPGAGITDDGEIHHAISLPWPLSGELRGRRLSRLTLWPRLGRHYNPECLGTNRVVKRRFHHTDFTVSGHVDPWGSGLHPYLLQLESA